MADPARPADAEFPVRVYAVREFSVPAGDPFLIVEESLAAIDEGHAGARVAVYRLEAVKILAVGQKELRDA